jgi:hypothetical protein
MKARVLDCVIHFVLCFKLRLHSQKITGWRLQYRLRAHFLPTSIASDVSTGSSKRVSPVLAGSLRCGSGVNAFDRSIVRIVGSIVCWPSHLTASRSSLDLTIIQSGSGTPPQEQCYRRSRAILLSSPQWPSHLTVIYYLLYVYLIIG